ncbi:hypothetical protein PF005_g944 [Phytophthora fragariae]|uniref:Uncharacterized protein n=1 Tax=Phytophthora fragariae TaxID=53985 RepID=A0A6A4AGA4_9STRA|nr:hypothetical protein PF010_g1409 [Phytophthora fragariae]KAE9236678.1 hypothetical protein PF005_g944 [Phytophthora fragariae]KAE9255689.1 hypothetical protein PF002_g2206 [Phytophthora fragariae]
MFNLFHPHCDRHHALRVEQIKRHPERNMGFYASLPVSVGISLKMPPRSPAFPTCRHSSLKSVASTLKPCC